MKNFMRWAACIMAGSVLLTSPGAAQLPNADRIPPKLTLEEALRLARTHSPVFLQTGNDLDVANANVRSAYGQFLPNVNANMGVSGGRSHVETYPDPITQKPAQLPNPTTSSGSSLSQGLSMGVTLFDGGRMLKNLAVQKANVDATSATQSVQEDALEAAVRQAFFTALREEQSIALSERLLVSAQDRLTQTEALFRTAAKGQVDLLGAREEIATQEMALTRAKADATKARLALAQAIGITSDGSFEVEGSLPEVYDPSTLNVDALLALALQSNPAVRRQQIAVTVAEKQASIAGTSRWPTLGASMSYGRSVSVPEFGALTAPYRYLNPQNSSMGFGFSIGLPVFSRFTTSASIATARAGAQDARLQLAQVRLQSQTDVRTAYIDFVNAFRSLQLADTKAALSNERLELSQDQYRRGSITFSELQQMIDRAAGSQRDALNARYVWISSLIALELRVGSPVVR
jgi:outer membrane protein